jgi:hypothetical protein
MRIIVAVVLLTACSRLHAAEPTLEERKVLGGKVSLLVPKAFKPMSAAMIKKKYPAGNPPTLVYTNAAANVNVALNHTDSRMPADELAAFHKAVEVKFKELHPSAEWFSSEVKKINGKEVFVMDFRHSAADTEVRNVMLGASLDGRLLIVTFNTTQALEKDWLAAGNKIIASVKIK